MKSTNNGWLRQNRRLKNCRQPTIFCKICLVVFVWSSRETLICFKCRAVFWVERISIRDLNPWPLRYRCSALPPELTSQLGATISTTSSVVFITARIAYIRFLYRCAHIWFSYISSHHSPNWHKVIEIFHSLIFVFTNKLGKEEAFISLFYEWDKVSLHEGPHNSSFDTSVSSPTAKVRGFQQRERRGGLPRALHW